MGRISIYSILILLSGALFFVPMSGSVQVPSPRDAFGVRVIKNSFEITATNKDPGEWPASVWYQRQCDAGVFTSCGGTQPIVVDGYDGIRVGNTAYVNATNLSGGTLFMNIYVFSLAENAGAAGQDIFNQVLQNVRFNTNITDAEAKVRLRRDTRRRIGMRLINDALDTYASVKRCSVTQTKQCAAHDECPGSETCGYQYPRLESGSYIRGISFSTWPSWNNALATALGTTLPDFAAKAFQSQSVDRTLTKQLSFVGCLNPYDPQTCWNETKREMACPLKAYVFGYRWNAPTAEQIVNPPRPTLATTYEFTTENGSADWSSENSRMDTVLSGKCKVIASITDNDHDDVIEQDEGGKKVDNCPTIANPGQEDDDKDGIGNVCDYSSCRPVNIEADGSIIKKTPLNPALFSQWIANPDSVAKPIGDATYVLGPLQRGSEVSRESSSDPNNDRDGDCVIGTADLCPADVNVFYDPDGDGIDSACDTSYKDQPNRSGLCGNRRVDGLLPPFNTEAEECDWGQWNNKCDPTYNEQCWVCNSSCKFEIRFGEYCGDGVIQGDEQCDPGDVASKPAAVPKGVACTPNGTLTCGASDGPNACTAQCSAGLVGYPVKGSAWNTNIGWVKMDPTGAGVAINMYNELVGSAWNTNIGWIHMTQSANQNEYVPQSRSTVRVDANGVVTGSAVGEQKWLGSILFNPSQAGVMINPYSGQFSGYAWAPGKEEGTGGWINFGTANGNVRTDWRP